MHKLLTLFLLCTAFNAFGMFFRKPLAEARQSHHQPILILETQNPMPMPETKDPKLPNMPLTSRELYWQAVMQHLHENQKQRRFLLPFERTGLPLLSPHSLSNNQCDPSEEQIREILRNAWPMAQQMRLERHAAAQHPRY